MTDEEVYSQAETGRAIRRIDALLEKIDRKVDAGFLAVGATLHDNYVTTERYEADDRTRIEIRNNLTDEVNEQGEEIVNLKADATRRARERRSLWLAIGAIAIPAIVAIVLAFHTTSRAVTCVPIPGAVTTQQSCTFH
jgi:hypothetical protein